MDSCKIHLPQHLMFHQERKIGISCFNQCSMSTLIPPLSVVSRGPPVVAPQAVDITGTPLSTSIYQDASSANTSSTTHETKSPVLSQGVE
ncbi:hypothetical protein Tco_0900283 [Tanacetum coccineum]